MSFYYFLKVVLLLVVLILLFAVAKNVFRVHLDQVLLVEHHITFLVPGRFTNEVDLSKSVQHLDDIELHFHLLRAYDEPPSDQILSVLGTIANAAEKTLYKEAELLAEGDLA